MGNKTRKAKSEHKKALEQHLADKKALTPKGPTSNRYTVEQKTQAMILWCTDYSMREIAEIMGIKRGPSAIHEWKKKKQPRDWDLMRQKVQKKTVEKTIRYTLSSLDEIRGEQQDRLRKVRDVSAMLISRKAQTGELKDEVAADLFMQSLREEQKLHLPLETVHGQKGLSVKTGAFTNRETGDSALLMQLDQLFEEKHGLVSKAGEPGQSDGSDNS